MENKKSYTDQMKSRVAEFRKKEVGFVLDVYIQMIIDEALYNFKKNLLEKQIDVALDSRNRKEFYQLAEQYNKLIN